jgi:hypothetical protein
MIKMSQEVLKKQFKIRKSYLIGAFFFIIIVPLALIFNPNNDIQVVDAKAIGNDLRDQLLSTEPYSITLKKNGIGNLAYNRNTIPSVQIGEASFLVDGKKLLIVYYWGKKQPFDISKIILSDNYSSETIYSQ